MPDLEKEAIHAFWDNYDRRTLYRVIVALERVEHWVLDSDAKVEAALINLGEAIDSCGDFQLGSEESFMRVLANTSAGRAMRLLQSLDVTKPGTASQLLMYAEESGEEGPGKSPNWHSQLFLRRNLVFERLQLLSRVFSAHRVSLVLKALEQHSE